MTTTAAITLSALLGIGLIGALALAVRLARPVPRPSRPRELAALTVEDEEAKLALAA
ncbi:MAG TPA: hypothetical protein VMU58_12225 [Gaiellaceae bacterium]|nr:hypothetical protein [Gaiellaceae bacterium]